MEGKEKQQGGQCGWIRVIKGQEEEERGQGRASSWRALSPMIRTVALIQSVIGSFLKSFQEDGDMI